MKLPISTFLAGLFLTVLAARGAELAGTVRSAAGHSAEVVLTGDLVPAAGDRATVFFLIPGGNDEVTVASGTVESVAADTVKLKLDDVTGAVAKDQQVRITSASPQKRAAMPPSPPVVPGNPPVIPNTPTVKSGTPPTITIRPGSEDSIRIVEPHDDGEGPFSGEKHKLTPIPHDGDGGEYTPAFAPHAGNGPVPFNPIPGDVNASPKTATEHFNKGYALLSSGKTTEAIASFTTAIKMESRYATAYYFRARASVDAKDYDTVVSDASKAIELNYTKQDDAYCLRGTGWARKGLFKKAIADHSAAIALNPRHALAWSNRAHDRLQMDDTMAAVADCDQSIALNPKSPLPYYNRGYAYFQLDMSQEAMDSWNKAIQLDPSFKKELEPLIESCKAGLPEEPHEPQGPSEAELKEFLKRVVPPGAESSGTVRPR